MAKANAQKSAKGSTLEFEAQLWAAADQKGEESQPLAARLSWLLSGEPRVPKLPN